MKSFTLKLRLVYYPFLLVAAGFILIYSILNGWLTMVTTSLPLKEDMTDVWIPLLLPFIPVLIWLQPRIKLLNLKSKRIDLPFLFVFVAGFAIGISAWRFQAYLRTATGKLTALHSISQIRDKEPTKYYKAEKFYIDTALVSFKNTYRISGKHDQYLTYNIYVVCPMFDDSVRDNTAPERQWLPQAWTCLKYSEQMSNRLSELEKEEKWQEFILATRNAFHHRNLSGLTYLDRVGNTDDRVYYEKDIDKNPYFSAILRPVFMLEPRFASYEARNGHKLGWAFFAFGIGALIWLIMVAIPKLNESVIEDAENAVA